jgi:DNA-binding MarR family transcriptional regulator
LRPSIDAEAPDLNPVSERDSDVLKIIEEEDLASFSFEGLKRRIRAHPETLSRTLDRLEEQSIVERGADGYRVTTKGREYLAVHPIEMAEQRLTLLKTMLPPSLDLQQVFHSLKGKWFGSLRWLGYSQDGGLVLKWVTDDGKVQLDAKFTSADLTIDGRLLQGKDLAVAVRAAHQLLAHISRSYASTRLGRTAFFWAVPSHLVPN